MWIAVRMISRLRVALLGVLQVLMARWRLKGASRLADERRRFRGKVGVVIHSPVVVHEATVGGSLSLLLLLLLVLRMLRWLLMMTLRIDDVVVMLRMWRMRRLRRKMVMIERMFVEFPLNENAVVALFADHGPSGQVVAEQKILENFTQLR